MKSSPYAEEKARYIILKTLFEHQTKSSSNRYYTLSSISRAVPFDDDYGRIYPSEVEFLLMPYIQNNVISRVTFESIDGGICATGVRINAPEIVKREIGSLEGMFNEERVNKFSQQVKKNCRNKQTSH